ncbi:hypothetical protein AAG747_23295 [Rapidithrix thailandica]|uniref:Uncharacterized protein n=1 Tax=Rapidithrix thailandica TaxID=413964 RepID=A0AAW9SJI0_9BACT
MKNRTLLYMLFITLLGYACSSNEETPDPTPENGGPGASKITAFQFPKSVNPQLEEDLQAELIQNNEGETNQIFIFVPSGIGFDKLTAQLTFNGKHIRYRQNPGSDFESYPTAGLELDYTYPKQMFLEVEGNEGHKNKTYQVFVDVKQPFKILEKGSIGEFIELSEMHYVNGGSIQNVGNQPLSLLNIKATAHIPVGFNFTTPMANFPKTGLLPNEQLDIQTRARAELALAGSYTVKTLWYPQLQGNPEHTDLYEGSPCLFNMIITEESTGNISVDRSTLAFQSQDHNPLDLIATFNLQNNASETVEFSFHKHVMELYKETAHEDALIPNGGNNISLAAGESKQITVSFKPAQKGCFSGEIELLKNGKTDWEENITLPFYLDLR